jgi:small subunit ribosomal protein S11
MAKKVERNAKKKFREKVGRGVAHIHSTFNNTIVTITTVNGSVLAWSSAGACGFKGARKKTPFAAKQAAETVAQTCVSQGMKEIAVQVKGAQTRQNVGWWLGRWQPLLQACTPQHSFVQIPIRLRLAI